MCQHPPPPRKHQYGRAGEGVGKGRPKKSVLQIVVSDLGGPLAAFSFCRWSPGGSGGLGLCVRFHLQPLDGKGCPCPRGAPVRVSEAVGYWTCHELYWRTARERPVTAGRDRKRQEGAGGGRRPRLPVYKLSGCASCPQDPETPRPGCRSGACQARGPPPRGSGQRSPRGGSA